MKLSIPFQWYQSWKDIECEIVDVAPHLARVATFALLVDPHEHKWSVCNLESGLNICRHEVKRECLEMARKKLAKKSIRQVQHAYRKAAKSYPQIAAEVT